MPTSYAPRLLTYFGMEQSSPGSTPRLTARQRRFVEEYAVDRNGVQAFFRAFGRNTAAGIPRSYRAAQVSASRLLSNPIIQTEVKAALREQNRRTRMTADRWVRALSRVALLEFDELYEADPVTGMPVPRRWQEVPVTARMALRGVKVTKGRAGGDQGYVEYVPCDRLKALELLGRHFGYLSDLPPLELLLARLPPKTADVIRKEIRESII